MIEATITPGELDGLRRSGAAVELIDVRTPVEYREVHAELARSEVGDPLTELPDHGPSVVLVDVKLLGDLQAREVQSHEL